MMAHLDSIVDSEAKSDQKFSFTLTQISSENAKNTYTSPVKKQASVENSSALES